MKIYFDFEITHTDIELSEKELIRIDIIRSHFISRLGVLKEEIESENGFIIIHNSGTMRKDAKNTWTIHDFSDSLTDKIKSCITDDDGKYISLLLKNNPLDIQ